jgi:hypothetical protein
MNHAATLKVVPNVGVTDDPNLIYIGIQGKSFGTVLFPR